jgi:riboflavin synthase
MFSGIIEETGVVARIAERPESIRLAVNCRTAAEGVRLGDSIAVNGCCLTVVRFEELALEFDLLRETWDRTSFHKLQPGALVNLERSLRADGRLHGHFVTGHVDGTGTIQIFERRGADLYLEITPPVALLRYLVPKGSIAIDGISLTVAEAGPSRFSVWIIPHTAEVTAIQQYRPGALVNLEADLLAKYVEKIAGSR